MTFTNGRVPKFVSGVLLAACVTACSSQVSHQSEPPATMTEVHAPAPPASDDGEQVLEHGMSLSMLMLQRQQLCLIPPTERLRLLDSYRAVFVEQTAPISTLPNFLPERLHKLNGLMLASCDPARTPGVLSEMLGVVTEGHWPAEYMAFFDVLVASHRAYALMDERYRGLSEDRDALQQAYEALRAEYEALQQEHQKTIEGISDIERGIDAPREDLGL